MRREARNSGIAAYYQPLTSNLKKRNEKNPTHSICSNVRFRVRIARMRVHRTTYGRDTPLCANRFWRDSHLQRLVDRH